jgi:hypothetical protein
MLRGNGMTAFGQVLTAGVAATLQLADGVNILAIEDF